MLHDKDTMPLSQTKETAYDSANRINALGNTVRVVYEQVLQPPGCLSASACSKRVMEHEDLSELVDAVLI
jgi:hypothetical protein